MAQNVTFNFNNCTLNGADIHEIVRSAQSQPVATAALEKQIEALQKEMKELQKKLQAITSAATSEEVEETIDINAENEYASTFKQKLQNISDRRCQLKHNVATKEEKEQELADLTEEKALLIAEECSNRAKLEWDELLDRELQC